MLGRKPYCSHSEALSYSPKLHNTYHTPPITNSYAALDKPDTPLLDRMSDAAGLFLRAAAAASGGRGRGGPAPVSPDERRGWLLRAADMLLALPMRQAEAALAYFHVSVWGVLK